MLKLSSQFRFRDLRGVTAYRAVNSLIANADNQVTGGVETQARQALGVLATRFSCYLTENFRELVALLGGDA